MTLKKLFAQKLLLKIFKNCYLTRSNQDSAISRMNLFVTVATFLETQFKEIFLKSKVAAYNTEIHINNLLPKCSTKSEIAILQKTSPPILHQKFQENPQCSTRCGRNRRLKLGRNKYIQIQVPKTD